MRNPSSMYAPVVCFQSSDSAGLMPSRVTWPLSGFSRSRSMRKSVVFPAPLLPTSPSSCPSLMLSEGMSQATVSPNAFLRFSIVIMTIA